MYLTLTNTGMTFNNNVMCGTNSLTCGILTCTTGTLGGKTLATTDLIPSLTGYAPLASAAFMESPTVNGNNILGRNTTLSPAYYGAGRRIELDVSTVNSAKIDFQFYDTNTSID